jgi:hypothetical protein
MRHFISAAAALAATLLAGCSESTTAPETTTPEHGGVAAPIPNFSATLPGTSVTITDGFCTQISTITGEVRCDYNVSNPDGLLLNIYPEAVLNLSYQCVNPSTGKVQSSGTGSRWAQAYVEGVTGTTLTGTGVKLGTPTLPNTYVKKYNKYNTCKGKQNLVITNYTIAYWDIYVDNWYSGQPSDQYNWTCLGQDDRYKCQTAILD